MASLNRILLNASRKKISSLKTLCTHKILLRENSFLGNLGQGHRLSLPNLHICFYSSDPSNTARILNHSTLIVQDGIDFEELPILIKRVTNNSFIFSSHSYSGGGKFQEETEFDTNFRQELHNCYSVNDIFKLLEVPSEKVRGLSASHALQRLHVLKYLNNDWNQIHSFIRSAVMRELYDTVQRDVVHLSNCTLISLVECYLAAEGFSPLCIDAINVEIQSRLGDEIFSIEELLHLTHILRSCKDTGPKHGPFFMGGKYSSVSVVSENSSRLLSNDESDDQKVKVEQFDKYSSKMSPQIREEIRKTCSEVLGNVWIHLTSRYTDADEHTLPLILEAATADNRNIVNLLQKPLARCWTDLSAEGVGLILDNLNRLRVYNPGIMVSLGRWAYVNVHQMTPPLLLSFLNTFIHFSFLDDNLVKVMERCLSLKALLVQTDVVAMCVEYCRLCRHLSPLVMDSAASHFTQYAYSYEPLQLFVVLRAFGQLNYLPNQPSAFLKKVESCLWDRFHHLQEVQLLEILGSFTFIGISPKHFYSRMCSNDFFTRVQGLSNHPKSVSLTWLKVIKHAILFNTSQAGDKSLTELLEGGKRHFVPFYQDAHAGNVHALKSALDDLLGCNRYHVLPFYGCCTIYLDREGVPLEITRKQSGGIDIQGTVAKKLVVLFRSAEHFVVNTKQLVGVQAQRLKQLTELGFITIEVRTSQFQYLDRETHKGGHHLLRMGLKPHINFLKVNSTRVTAELDQTSSPSKDVFWDKLGYSCEDDDDDILLFLLPKSKGVPVESSGLLSGQEEAPKDKDEPD